MKIRSNMNKLVWRHHCPIISLWDFFGALGHLTKEWSDLAEIRTRPRFYACPRYLQEDLIENNREKVETSFSPIISQWALSVAMETRVLIRPKTVCSLSLTPVMQLHIQFVQDWPSGLRYILRVRKCGQRWTDADHWHTIR